MALDKDFLWGNWADLFCAGLSDQSESTDI